MKRIPLLSLFLLFPLCGLTRELDTTMHLALLKSPLELSPFTYLSLNEWYAHINITASLVELNAENQIVSGIAKTFSLSNDGKTCKLVLDTDYFWSDGTPITPREVVLSLTQEVRHKNSKYLSKILAKSRSKKQFIWKAEIRWYSDSTQQTITFSIIWPALSLVFLTQEVLHRPRPSQKRLVLREIIELKG